MLSIMQAVTKSSRDVDFHKYGHEAVDNAAMQLKKQYSLPRQTVDS
jgi:hypothetical protein